MFMTAIYGFWATSIDELAETLNQALEIHLYRQFSPMIGPWYIDEDLYTVVKAFKEGEEVQSSGKFELVLNDPESGYTAPDFPGEGDCILRVRAGPDELAEIEEKLRKAGLQFKLLQD
jgi:hypothetical protein